MYDEYVTQVEENTGYPLSVVTVPELSPGFQGALQFEGYPLVFRINFFCFAI